MQIILFLDSGDTLVDESSEIRDEHDVVVRAHLFEDTKSVLQTLHAGGYPIALVADGLRQSFLNIYEQHNLMDIFHRIIDSETVGVCKPAPAMFETAMKAFGLTSADTSRIVMVGNNLERDIVGANCMGIVSVHIDHSPRYRAVPQTEEEIPNYTIHSLSELIPVLEKIKAESPN